LASLERWLHWSAVKQATFNGLVPAHGVDASTSCLCRSLPCSRIGIACTLIYPPV